MSMPNPPCCDSLGSEYTLDILAWLKEKEVAGGMQCRRQSPQLSRRRHLVEWSCDKQLKLGLSDNSLHLAIRLVDLFMDGHDIQDPQLYLVCLGGLLLAAKMEEKDGKIPRCSQLNVFTNNYFPLSDFFNLEFVMLNYFQWNICLPTAHYFSSMLLPHSLLPTDLHNNGPILCMEKLAAYFQVYVDHFLKVSLMEPTFMESLPSIVAAAVISAARRAFGLSPRWPDNLEMLTGYSEIALCSLTSTLLQHHLVEENNDEGYESFTASPVPASDHHFLAWGDKRMETGEVSLTLGDQ